MFMIFFDSPKTPDLCRKFRKKDTAMIFSLTVGRSMKRRYTNLLLWLKSNPLYLKISYHTLFLAILRSFYFARVQKMKLRAKFGVLMSNQIHLYRWYKTKLNRVVLGKRGSDYKLSLTCQSFLRTTIYGVKLWP